MKCIQQALYGNLLTIYELKRALHQGPTPPVVLMVAMVKHSLKLPGSRG